jgi:hypothetical protein
VLCPQLGTIHGLDCWLGGLRSLGWYGGEKEGEPRADPRGGNLGCEGGYYQIRTDDISKTVTGQGLIGVANHKPTKINMHCEGIPECKMWRG